MKTVKDIIFVTIGGCWLLSNILASFIFGPIGGMLSNLNWIVVFGILVLIKLKSKKFSNWLNKEL